MNAPARGANADTSPLGRAHDEQHLLGTTLFHEVAAYQSGAHYRDLCCASW